MVIYFIKVILLGIFTLTSKYLGLGKKIKNHLKNQVFFKEFIYLFIEGYIEYLLSGVIGATKIKPLSNNDKFIVHATTFLVIAICCVILPGMLIYVLF